MSYPKYVAFKRKKDKSSAMIIHPRFDERESTHAIYIIPDDDGRLSTGLRIEAKCDSRGKITTTSNNPIHLCGKELVEITEKEFKLYNKD